jgi:uncharacterized coiled-coil DUF342 family protein
MEDMKDELDLQKLSNRDMLLLLNERYGNLHREFDNTNNKLDGYIKDVTDLRIEMVKLKTKMQVWGTVIAFIAATSASVLTALMIK